MKVTLVAVLEMEIGSSDGIVPELHIERLKQSMAEAITNMLHGSLTVTAVKEKEGSVLLQ